MQSQISTVYGLAGRYAAVFVTTTDNEGEGPAGLAVADLRTGGRRVVQDLGSLEETGPQRIDKAVVRATGDVAWADSTPQPDGSMLVRIARKNRAAGSPTILDRGSAIDPQSLHLDGTHITWTDNGSPKSARLG
jgi:hypothetical protein